MNHSGLARHAVLLAAGVALVASAALMPPVHQDVAFHNFADQRTLVGIHHFWNVVSNVPFAVIGLAGCLWLLRARNTARAFAEPWERNAYFVFFSAEFLTCFVSAYYHANPNNQNLLWDRLAFILLPIAFFPALLTEYVNRPIGKRLLAPLVLLGLCSVLYWRQTGDLRFYILVQFYPVLAAPLIFLLFRSHYTRAPASLLAWALFVAAKLCELYDTAIFRSTGILSGHTLKHFLAAAATYALFRGLQHRCVRRMIPAANLNTVSLKGLAS